jgi:hypothetical protein
MAMGGIAATGAAVGWTALGVSENDGADETAAPADGTTLGAAARRCTRSSKPRKTEIFRSSFTLHLCPV